MKRTPLARRSRLVAKSRIATKQALARGSKQLARRKKLVARAVIVHVHGSIARTASPQKPRKKLRAFGRRARREKRSLMAFRRDVLARAEGRCARCRLWFPDHELEAHHVVGRGRAKGWEHLHNAEHNGVALCKGPQGCHALVTAHACSDWREWIKSAPAGWEKNGATWHRKGGRAS